MKKFIKWAFSDRQHRNRIILSTVFLIVICVLMWQDPATPFWNTIFLSFMGLVYFANWIIIYKIYKR